MKAQALQVEGKKKTVESGSRSPAFGQCSCTATDFSKTEWLKMAPVANSNSPSSTWSSSMDYESHHHPAGISSSLMMLPVIQQQQQQRFRNHYPTMKSYGSVSSFEDPYVSLLGPAKPPRVPAAASGLLFRNNNNNNKFSLATTHQNSQQQQQQHRRISKSDWDLVSLPPRMWVRCNNTK